LTSPVVRALERARLDAQVVDWERSESAMKAALLRRLGGQPPADDVPEWAMALAEFRTWCEENGVRHCPARPEVVAQFVLDHAASGLEMLAGAVAAVSQAHSRLGMANPTATWMVARALQRVGDIAPPRSWPRAFKSQFSELPVQLKRYIATHDAERERVLRRAQNEAARAKRDLAALRSSANNEQKAGERDGGSDTQ
jgi:hypothetical protein